MNIVMRSGAGHCTVGNMRGSGGNRVAPSQPLPGAQRLFVANPRLLQSV